MARFTITPLADGRYLVEGTDRRDVSGVTTVDGTQWDDIKRRKDVQGAHADFDKAFEAFYAPLVEAAEKLGKAHVVEVDPLSYVVESEAVEATRGQAEQLTKLSRDSIILRAIETGQDDRLVWVNDDLVVTAAAKVVPSTTVEDVPENAGNAEDYAGPVIDGTNAAE